MFQYKHLKIPKSGKIKQDEVGLCKTRTKYLLVVNENKTKYGGRTFFAVQSECTVKVIFIFYKVFGSRATETFNFLFLFKL